MDTPEWQAPPKPAEFAESCLIDAILTNAFPIDSHLPAERELALQLGITRPTLREALQRLARDGWVEIHHGRPTRVRNYWQEGNLGVLGTIVRHSDHLPGNFVTNLLTVRQSMAPAYVRLAVENSPTQAVNLLESLQALEDTPETFADADWKLHHRLTIAAGNPIFTLILNGFRDFYPKVARIYFSQSHSRQVSQHFYQNLLVTAINQDAEAAERITRQMMVESLNLWQAVLDQD